MKSAVILNATAGPPAGRRDPSGADLVRAAFQRAGIEAIVTAPERDSFVAAVRNAVGSDADVVVPFSSAPPGILKVLVTHHPFLPPPLDPSPPIVGRAMEALRAAEACGVDPVLAGHLHHGYTGDVRTHHTGIGRAILVAQAGTATSHRVRNEPNSYNVILAEPERLRFSLRVWDGTRFVETRTAAYVKAGPDWTPELKPEAD